ncbi:hypothetical protein SUGI_0019580 [Cryptomeria japonica]|nr:hypothetical protein SUGI_0019580 [Cryptomeria japonica]
MKYFMKVIFLILPTLLMNVIPYSGALIIEVPSRPEARKLLEIAPTGARYNSEAGPAQSPVNGPSYSVALENIIPSDAPDASRYAPDTSPFLISMDGRT